MRDAHLAQPCRVGLKLRFARRPMAAQGLRPPPPDWEGCFAAWENWESFAILEPMENLKLLFPDESYAIRGALYEVYREIGNGLREEVYQQCLEREFALSLGLTTSFSSFLKFPKPPEAVFQSDGGRPKAVRRD